VTGLILSDVAEISSEPLPRNRVGDVKYIATGNVSRTGIVSSTIVNVEERPSRANLIANFGDVLLAKMASTVKVLVITDENKDFVYSTGFARLRPKNGYVDTEFLAHWLRSERFQNEKDSYATGATQRAITESALARTSFPNVELQRQREIASILSACEDVLEAKTKSRALVAELEESLIANTFVKSDWPLKRIADLGKVKTGKTPPTSATGMFGGSIPFVTPGDLNVFRASLRTLTEAGARSSRTVRSGSTLVCCIGATIGKTDLAGSTIAFNQQINAIEWSDQLDDLFGLAALRFLKPEVIAAGASTTLPLLPKSRFSELQIPVAPLEVQKAFARKYAAVRELTVSVEGEIYAAEEFLASVQKEFFTGAK
jgi:type I restriction enzyme S subunit